LKIRRTFWNLRHCEDGKLPSEEERGPTSSATNANSTAKARAKGRLQSIPAVRREHNLLLHD
jgi:hypothetical protein